MNNVKLIVCECGNKITITGEARRDIISVNGWSTLYSFDGCKLFGLAGLAVCNVCSKSYNILAWSRAFHKYAIKEAVRMEGSV